VHTNVLHKRHNLPYLNSGAGVAVGDLDGDGLADAYLVGQDNGAKLFRQVAPFEFVDVTEECGVEGGAGWKMGTNFVDFDGDGDLDIYLCRTEARNRLYRNDTESPGALRFTEVGAEFGLDHVGVSMTCAWADFDRDGDLDLYLLKNRVFSPRVPRFLIAEIEPPIDTQVSPRDLLPDLPDFEIVDGVPVIPDELRDELFLAGGELYPAGQRDLLFRNELDQGGTFVDGTDDAGLQDQAMGLSVDWWDFDDDGWLDIYVANDLESSDQLWHNRGDGTFEEVAARMLPQVAYFGMGSDTGDLDNDGDLDLIVADMSQRTHRKAKILMGDMDTRAWVLEYSDPPQAMRNALLLNAAGTGRFLEAGNFAHVASTDWTWTMKFGDMDNDGWLDLYVTNGIARFDQNPDLIREFRSLQEQGKYQEAQDLARAIPAVPERNVALRNAGDGDVPHFDDVSADWGLDLLAVSHGASWVDLDHDGDLDLIVNNQNGPAALYENTTASASGSPHAVTIRLIGAGRNPYAVGARVRVTAGGRTYLREMQPARGYFSSDEPLLHFGLGDAAKIERIEIRWPTGEVQVHEDLPVDHRHTIRQRPNASPEDWQRPKPKPMFEDVAEAVGLDAYRHRERLYDDYASQPLVPHRHSVFGPGIAWGDADGDGAQDDLFVGGAAGSIGAVLVRGDDGRFRRTDQPALDAAIEHEDLGALWFDADGDGDDDLYVVSGSNEAPADRPDLYGDRLYLNDGSGLLTRAAEATPPAPIDADGLPSSGGPVAAADFDGDGDLDLFVGARQIPNRYPLIPQSSLLRNDGGTFLDITDSAAPGLARAGLVTAAVWTDLDGDGDLDLLTAAHWQPLRFWRNDGGVLREATAEAGLDAASGLWNGLEVADLDGDGDLDLVATNLGLNTKYKAKPGKPYTVFCRDFDDSGSLDVIEAKYQGDELLPVRGRSCSSRAIPVIGENFPTYEAFARAPLHDIYDSLGLEQAQRFEVDHLAATVFENDGRGRFTPRDLPALAQLAPSFGIAVLDVDCDARPDLVIGQNFRGPEPETGKMASGLGVVLRNATEPGGPLRFAPLEPGATGFVVPEDAKGVTLVDLDEDGAPDLVVGANGSPVRAFARRAAWSGLRVDLVGEPGNPRAIGARVTCIVPDSFQQTLEVRAGAGHLGQSPATLWFGLPEDAVAGARLDVRWPDGATTQHVVTDGERRVVLKR
jgi:hypothetical protein